MIDVVELLKNNKEISDYKVITNIKESYELFFVQDKLETVRATNTTNCKVFVYVDHSKFRGSKAFSISNNETVESVNEKIKDAIETAKIINNKSYKLPANEFQDIELESNFKDYEAKELGYKIYKVVSDCASKSKAKFNACEIFINKHKRHIVNGSNIDKTEITYDAMIELIPTCDLRGKGNSVELYKAIHISKFDEEELSATIKQSLKDVMARSRAKKPEYSINCNVILRSDEISQIISEIVYNLSYGAVYSKSNLYNLGDSIQKNAKYDLLDVTLRGQLEGSSNSHAFDSDGVSLSNCKVIYKGVAKSLYGISQFAQYLNRKVTGDLRLIDLKKGSHSNKELKFNPYLECVSFSGLQVDIANDYIGGEVRLANYFDGEKVHPITGISISGKFSDVINSIKLSNKVVCESNYKGPNIALVEGFKIF